MAGTHSMENAMGYAIEMHFDTQLEQRIRQLWQDLAGNGQGLLQAIGSRPHVTLACYEQLDVPTVAAALPGLAWRLQAAPISLSSVGCFPGASPVLFLTPQPSAWLLAARQALETWAAPLGLQPTTHTRIDAWVPHCTMAQELPPPQQGAAWRELESLALPWIGRLEGLQLVSYRPVETHAAVPFGDDLLQYEIITGQDPRLQEALDLHAQVFDDFLPEHVAMIQEEVSIKPRLMTVVCRANDNIVGFKMGFRRGPGQFHSWLGGVHPDWRRGGIGDGLMRRQHDWCAANGYHTVRTVTVQEFAAMFSLNLRHGFQVVGTMASPRGAKLILEKSLTPPQPSA